MPPGRTGTDTERGAMPMSPGVVFDASGNPVGFADDDFTPGGGAFPPPSGPPATGPNVPPAPGSPPAAPRAPRNTSAPRTPNARAGRGGALSRILRGAASRLRGGNRGN